MGDMRLTLGRTRDTVDREIFGLSDGAVDSDRGIRAHGEYFIDQPCDIVGWVLQPARIVCHTESSDSNRFEIDESLAAFFMNGASSCWTAAKKKRVP